MSKSFRPHQASERYLRQIHDSSSLALVDNRACVLLRDIAFMAEKDGATSIGATSISE